MAVVGQAEKLQHRLAFLGKGAHGLVVGEALGNGLVGRALRIGFHMPEGRAADGGGDHEPQHHARMAQENAPDGGMAVQFDIVLRRSGKLGPGRLRFGVRFAACLSLLGLALASGLLAGEPTLVEFDRATVAHGDVDAPAVLLGRLLVLPGLESLARLENRHVGPAVA